MEADSLDGAINRDSKFGDLGPQCFFGDVLWDYEYERELGVELLEVCDGLQLVAIPSLHRLMFGACFDQRLCATQLV